jgi:deazaflavin-dependent oxidoreductase (nitroreductase family)
MSPERRHMSFYERAMETFARTPMGDWYLKRLAPRIDPPLLRLTGGRVSTLYPNTVMLLTTIGAKSGQSRTLPLGYMTDGDGIILVASNYCGTSHPAWYRNLTANPRVEVLAGKRSGTYIAREIVDPAERDRAWTLALDYYAGYGDYEARTGGRTIPLIRLERAAER